MDLDGISVRPEALISAINYVGSYFPEFLIILKVTLNATDARITAR